jgi:ribosome-associated protein
MTAGGAAEGGVEAGAAPVAVALPITLGQFLKAAGLASTGGEAKYLITSGLVSVNDVVETHRGRKLAFGDVVSTDAGAVSVADPESPPISTGTGRPER